MQIAITQLVNGLVLGVLLFLMSAGLSLIFGLMNVVNVAHGSFFMLGAFFALAPVLSRTAWASSSARLSSISASRCKIWPRR